MSKDTPTIFDMGTGETLITHGFHKGFPCIGVMKAAETGEPGQLAGDHLKDEMSLKGTFIRFHNMDSVLRFMDHIKKMVEELEAELRKETGIDEV